MMGLMGLSGAVPASAADLFRPAAAGRSTSSFLTPDKTIKRQRLADVDVAVLTDQILPAGSDMAPDRADRSRRRGGKVSLQLFQDVRVNLRRSEVEAGFDGGVVWSGDLATGGFGILVINGNRITGAVESAGRHFLIEPVGTGASHRVREIDTEAYPQDIHMEPPGSGGKKARHDIKTAATDSRAVTVTYVTLFATYTSRAATILGATTLADKIKLDVALTNQGLRNSGIATRIQLVGIKPVKSTYNERASADAAQPLYDITYGTTYNFPGLRTWRNTLAADLVTMYIDRPEYCGIAWVLYPSLNPNYGFSAINAACQGTLTLAHELGHNMGLYHDRYVEPAAPNSQYNFGYVSLAGAFRTIMSYSNRCTAAGIVCSRITYYSTPLRSYLGLPVGIAAGQPGAADASRKLRENTAGVAAFR